MKAVIRLFGEKADLEWKIKEQKPHLHDFYIVGNCMDNAVFFEEISEDDYYDLLDELDDFVYNDKDVSLEESLVTFLKENKLKIAVAESCTGGLISASIINVSGASEVFYEGIVSYSNDSKENRLGVSKDTLMAYGAVSAETAQEMAYGLISDDVDIAISTTGIAGPTGGTAEKPVGLVYIGIADKLHTPVALKNNFDGNREQVRKSAKNAGLFYALQYLKNNY